MEGHFVFPDKHKTLEKNVSFTESSIDGLQTLEGLDGISPIPIAPQLKMLNTQRRLRIDSEDHKLFLSDLSEDVLSFIEECNHVMSIETKPEQNLIPEKQQEDPPQASKRVAKSNYSSDSSGNVFDSIAEENNDNNNLGENKHFDVKSPNDPEPTHLRRKRIRVIPKITLNEAEDTDPWHQNCTII